MAALVFLHLRPDQGLPGALAAVAAAVVATAAVGAWRAGRRARGLAALAAESAELSRTLEAAVDRSWELEESEERYRSLVDARERAEAANRAKSRFLATVSHEFRTPLNGILGLNRLLLETGLTPAQETYARGVQSSGAALLTLIEDMLDFSKIEAGRLDIRPEPIDVAALVAEVAELLAAKAYRKGIDIGVDVDPGVPPRVAADPTRLRQVLVNLVGNAVKFTDTGGVTIRVTLERRSRGNRARLAFTVADTGPGIPDAEAERLFGEFEQADSALTRRHGGTGLGLAISRRLVAAMGGVLVVEPHPGGGSVFRFTVDSEVAAGAAPDLSALAGLRLIAIMPDGAEAPVVGKMLGAAAADARVVATVNAGAALLGAAAAANLPYDAVLVDRRLAAEAEPVLALLRDAAGMRIPAVALVEPAERAAVGGLGAAGFDGCLVRPVRRASLLAVTRNALSATGRFHSDPHGEALPEAPRRRRPAAGGPVLLAEDNEISALLARAVIESLGHVVTDVRDGNAAVAAAMAGRYDAVFLDLHMPGCDGLAAAARIRAHEQVTGRPPTPIIALTADALPETRRAALAAGIDSLLEKPVAPETLRAALAAALDRRDAA